MDHGKVFHAGRARQEELDEIDSCRLCEIMPQLAETCYATAYCHRQMKMDLEDNRNVKDPNKSELEVGELVE